MSLHQITPLTPLVCTSRKKIHSMETGGDEGSEVEGHGDPMQHAELLGDGDEAGIVRLLGV